MRKVFCLLPLAFLAVQALSQKTINDEHVEARTVSSSFKAIEVSSGIDLYLSQGDEAVAVSAKEERVKQNIRTEVDGNVLKIYFKRTEGIKMNWNTKGPIKVYVSCKELNSLIVSGGSDVIIVDKFRTKDMSINISGGADLRGKIECDYLSLVQSGGSDVTMTGLITKLRLRTSGGSDFDGDGLSTDICDIEASGGSDVSVTVNKELTAEASGASDVHWKGTATVKSVRASGAGSVKHK